LPPDIRFQPPQPGSYGAMVAAARDNDGNLLAVQRVFIHDGKKAPIQTPKRTNGVMDGAAVRLTARHGDELVLAEGPETGLSVWQAWGRETWIALGSVGKLVDTVPTDCSIVIARDADASNSQADKALIKAIAAMIERGVSVRVVSPPNPTKQGYDFNDALQDYGNDAVARTLENGGWLKPRYLAPTGTVTEARVLVHSVFCDWTASLLGYWDGQVVFNTQITDIMEDRA
jgi:putative DNA primase/helicase